MDRDDFIQSSVRIRLAEKKLLTKHQIERIAEAKDLEEAIRMLGETAYSKEISKLERQENYEIVLSKEINDTYKEVLSISPNESLVNILSYKYNFHNLKLAIKERILNEDFTSIYCLLEGNKVDDFRKKVENPKKFDTWYSDIVIKAMENFDKTKDPQEIDFFLDREYFKKVLSVSKDLKLELIEEYFKALIDFINIRTFIRFKKQNQVKENLEKALFEGGDIKTKEIIGMFFEDVENIAIKFRSQKIGRVLKDVVKEYRDTGSLQNYEKYMDDYLTDILKMARRINYGPEVIFAFLLAKETEIKNLRVILVGKLNELSKDFIKERLRETYV